MKRKRERQANIKKLTTRIHILERAHKSTLATSSLNKLIQARTELLEELGKRTKQNYMLTRKNFYEFGNKSGKMLANALQNKKASTTIIL